MVWRGRVLPKSVTFFRDFSETACTRIGNFGCSKVARGSLMAHRILQALWQALRNLVENASIFGRRGCWGLQPRLQGSPLPKMFAKLVALSSHPSSDSLWLEYFRSQNTPHKREVSKYGISSAARSSGEKPSLHYKQTSGETDGCCQRIVH